jgi:hypothetical protein
MPTRHYVKTLATTSSSWLNPEALAACEVLAHPRVAFHPCTCGLYGGAGVVAATLISCDDVEVAAGTTMSEETIMIDYFLYTEAQLCWTATPTLLPLLKTSSGNDL